MAPRLRSTAGSRSASRSRQLRQQINSFQSFHKEMEQFVSKEKPPVPEKKEKGDKVLKMMGAFLNAFERSSK